MVRSRHFAGRRLPFVALFVCLLGNSLVAQETPDSSIPNIETFIAHTPTINVTDETDQSVSLVAELPTPLLKTIRCEVSCIDGVQKVRTTSQQGTPIAAFNDGHCYTYDCIGPKLTLVHGVWFSLTGNITEDRVNLGFGFNSQGTYKIQLDPAAFLKLAHEPVIEAIEDSRYRVTMASPSGNSKIVATYDASSELRFESIELAAENEDGSPLVMFRLSEVRMGTEAREVDVVIPTRSDVPEMITVNEATTDSILTAGMQVMHLLKLTMARIGLENPEVRDDPTLRTILGSLNWDRMSAADQTAMELLKPILDPSSGVRTGQAADEPIR